MAVTLAAVIAVQVAAPIVLRPHLMEPATQTVSITKANLHGMLLNGKPPHVKSVGRIDVDNVGHPGAWDLTVQTVTAKGKATDKMPAWMAECGPGIPATMLGTAEGDKRQAACFNRMADEGYQQKLSYHSANHFWTLQWRETGVLLGLAALLTGFCFWRIRRDLT